MGASISSKARFLKDMVNEAMYKMSDIYRALGGYDTRAYRMALFVSYKLYDLKQDIGDLEMELSGRSRRFDETETTMVAMIDDDTNDAVEDFHCKVDLLNHWLWNSKMSDEDYTWMMRQALDEMMAHVMGKEER